MAKVTTTQIIKKIQGEIDGMIFKVLGGKQLIAKKADLSNVEPSAKQLAGRENFKQAVVYGKVTLAEPDKRAPYDQAAKETGKPILSIMIADFYHAPSVEEIDVSAYTGKVGDIIKVQAEDDFDVVGVIVTINNSEGAIIESGAAGENPPDSGSWTYTATQAVAVETSVRITVEAKDNPGHKGEKTQEKAV